jgi:hypothetical protein
MPVKTGYKNSNFKIKSINLQKSIAEAVLKPTGFETASLSKTFSKTGVLELSQL